MLQVMQIHQQTSIPQELFDLPEPRMELAEEHYIVQVEIAGDTRPNFEAAVQTSMECESTGVQTDPDAKVRSLELLCRDYKGIADAAQQAQVELTTELEEKTEELELLRTE